MNYELDAFLTIVVAVLVLFIGYFFVHKISILKKYNIPEPVAGGLVAAIITFILFKNFNITVNFDAKIQQIFMLMFFTSVGLSASLGKLKEGGKALVLFLGCVIIFVILQNIVGISLAKILGLDPLIGLITGSVTLSLRAVTVQQVHGAQSLNKIMVYKVQSYSVWQVQPSAW